MTDIPTTTPLYWLLVNIMALYQSFSIHYIKVRSASKVFSWIDFVFFVLIPMHCIGKRFGCNRLSGFNFFFFGGGYFDEKRYDMKKYKYLRELRTVVFTGETKLTPTFCCIYHVTVVCDHRAEKRLRIYDIGFVISLKAECYKCDIYRQTAEDDQLLTNHASV